MRAKTGKTQMNANGTQMNAERIKAADTWALAWSQEPHSPRLSAAWKRRLAALLAEFRAVFWSWS